MAKQKGSKTNYKTEDVEDIIKRKELQNKVFEKMIKDIETTKKKLSSGNTKKKK